MKEMLLEQLREILAEGQSRGDILTRVCEFIKEGLPGCDWVGFYFVDDDHDDELVLGPFAGEPTEHTRIRFGQGVCGKAAKSAETVVVDDVSAEPNYLSCSPKVKSEIVIPLCKGGQVIGELDIDSHTLAAFGDKERELLEEACELIVGVL